MSLSNEVILAGPRFTKIGVSFEFASLPINVNETSILMQWALGLVNETQLAIYLTQLFDEEIAKIEGSSFVITWPNIYYLLSSSEHEGSQNLLSLPHQRTSKLSLEERGTLSSSEFSIYISGYVDPQGRVVPVTHMGPVFKKGNDVWLGSAAENRLIAAIEEINSLQGSSQIDRQIHFGRVREEAINANARLSPYLSSVIVITPANLIINYSRQEALGVGVAVIHPTFKGAPDDWLNKFDQLRDIPEHLDFTSSSIAGYMRIIFSEPVRTVLQTIKRDFPGRRAGGAKAEAFLRNPFAFLGEDADVVIDPEQIEKAKAAAGIVPTSLKLLPPEIKNGMISRISALIQITYEDHTGKTIREVVSSPGELTGLVDAAQSSCDNEGQFFRWRNHVIDIDCDTDNQLKQAVRILHTWKRQIGSIINYEDIYTFNDYYERIAGIGVPEPIYSPYIQKKDGEKTPWTPENLLPFVNVQLSPDAPPVSVQLDSEWLEELREKVARAKVTGESEILDDRLPLPLRMKEAEPLLDEFTRLLNSTKPSVVNALNDEGDEYIVSKKSVKMTSNKESLLIKANINELEYSEMFQAAAREKRLKLPENSKPCIPASLLPAFTLEKHQLDGVAWMQHLISHCPQDCRGALLADDMGLGKTLQLLTLLADHYEKNPYSQPSLIVAPVALMKNWIKESKTFFKEFPEILLLHSEGLSRRKQPKALIASELLEKKISNLLIPDWLGSAKIVLTTYETVRDYEFSLAKQDFNFVICDEAQRIKTPNALVTLALKKQKAKFRIACTGTPVENTLADIWCLFDFIQPGLLGDLSEFSGRYRRPIEAKDEEQSKAINCLRGLISLQMLRRMKEDISDRLPRKILVTNYENVTSNGKREMLAVQISNYQRSLYVYGIEQLKKASVLDDSRKRANISFGILHLIRAICAEPYCRPGVKFNLDPDGYGAHLKNSPKMKWTLDELERIAKLQEKVIIFTEVKEFQRALVEFIHHKFGFTPSIINGDINDRQDRIDKFEAEDGFGVIILSPLAVGFGVNIVSANHVIHYSRTWNAAKEGQATDRAYRIGQKKDVYVYCPTIMANDFVTFEDKLDRLINEKMKLSQDILNASGGDFSYSELRPTSGPGGATDCVDEIVDISIVDGLSHGSDFEKFCKILLGRSAKHAYVTPSSKDFGVDVVVIYDDETGLICQCKLAAKTELGWDAVKDVVGGAQTYQAKHPNIRFKKVAICNRKFNANANESAVYNGVRLIERDEIMEMLNKNPIKRVELDDEILNIHN